MPHKEFHDRNFELGVFVENILEELTRKYVPESRRSDITTHSYLFILLADTIDDVLLLIMPGAPTPTE